MLASFGSRGSNRTCSQGRPDRRIGFWDAVKGPPGKRKFAKANEGFSAECVTGMIVAIKTNGSIRVPGQPIYTTR